MSSTRAVAWIGCLGLAAAMGIGRFAFTPMLPPMLAEGRLVLDQGSALALANYLGYFAGAVAAALHPADAGRRARLGLALIALTTLGMGWAEGMPAWWALRFASGVASAMVLVGVSAWALPRLTAGGAAGRAGIVYAGVGLGITLAGLLVLLGKAAGLGSGTTWLALGVLASLATLAAWPTLAPAAPASPTFGAAAASPAPPRWRATAPLLLAYGAMGYGYIIPATYLPTLAQRQLDPAWFGWIWPAFGLAAAASTWFVAGWLRHRAPRSQWRWAQTAMALGVAAPLLHDGGLALASSAVLVGGSFMVVTMAGMQEARRIGGGAALMAAMTAAFALGQIAGPWSVSRFTGAGFAVGPSIAAVLWLVLGVGLLWLAPRPADRD